MYRPRAKHCGTSISSNRRRFFSVSRNAIASCLPVSNHRYEVFKVARAIYRVVTLFLIGVSGTRAGVAEPAPISPHFASARAREFPSRRIGGRRLSARSISS
jgi:hypothetical protein